MTSTWRTTPLPKNWPRIRARILRRDGYLCQVCKRQKATAVDHVVPASRGGTDDAYNLQAICDACHVRKTAEERRARRRRDEEPHPGAVR